jgi:mRNA interferase MazF
MARRVSRGDIWLYRFGKPDKRRPVLVLSRNAALEVMNTAVVAAITSTIRGAPSELRVTVDDGLKNESVASFDHIYTVPQVELRQYVGTLDAKRMRTACRALGIAMGCS